MMYLCCMVSDLSNHDSCQLLHLCVLIHVSFCLVIYSGAIRVWFKHKWRGVGLESSLWEPEVLEFHEFFTALLSIW